LRVSWAALTAAVSVTGTIAGAYSLRVEMTAAGGVALPPVVLDVAVQP